jgi:primary-amine oxidase
VGNYEYGFFWYFYLDGTLQMEVKLTGIVGVSAVADGTEQPEYAPLIAPNLASPVHQHLFNFRLDFDLDGGPNSVYEVNTIPLPSDHADNPHGTAFHAEAKLLARESEAQRNVNAASSRNWKVVNPESKNRMGIPVAYKLLPGATPVLLANPDSPVGKRAAFATHNLWVTPYDESEMSAAGDHTNLHPGGAGLSAWTQQDRDIENTDVVLWHTVGLTHVPRPEDWPVMPVEYCGFMLQPVGFFERNPALDLPGEAHC